MKEIYRSQPTETEYLKHQPFCLRLSDTQYNTILYASKLQGVDKAEFLRESIALTSYLLDECTRRATNQVDLISHQTKKKVRSISIPYFNPKFGVVQIESPRHWTEQPLNPFDKYYKGKLLNYTFSPDVARLLHSISLWNRVAGMTLTDRIAQATSMALGTYLVSREKSGFCNYQIISNLPNYENLTIVTAPILGK